MRRLPNDIDIHTHGTAHRRDAVVCIDPSETKDIPEVDAPLLSVGIHPWNAGCAYVDVKARFEAMLDDPRVVAVGEIGFDRARGPEIDVQTRIFDYQARIADSRDMPVVIHCVRAFDLLLAAKKRLKPGNQWIVHGFRGNPVLAQQLLDAGIDLSFGEKYNTAAYDLTPPQRRYFETD